MIIKSGTGTPNICTTCATFGGVECIKYCNIKIYYVNCGTQTQSNTMGIGHREYKKDYEY